MLEINNISHAYAGNMVTHKLNAQVRQGEIVCIVGESGCGKTTLLKSILGLLPPQAQVKEGDILYKGQSLLSLQGKQWNKIRGEEIAMVFQDAGLSLNPVRKIGKQFVQYIRSHRAISKEEAWKMAEEKLLKMNLDPQEIRNAYPFQLSGGMKQRVGLAFALSLQPSFLLLDEPTSALDVTTQAQVVEEILQIKEQTTILMITHNIPLAIYMADFIIIMKEGSIVEQNTAEDIFKQPKHPYTKELLEHIPHLQEVSS